MFFPPFLCPNLEIAWQSDLPPSPNARGLGSGRGQVLLLLLLVVVVVVLAVAAVVVVAAAVVNRL